MSIFKKAFLLLFIFGAFQFFVSIATATIFDSCLPMQQSLLAQWVPTYM
jgi:hypothetical protein